MARMRCLFSHQQDHNYLENKDASLFQYQLNLLLSVLGF